MQRSNNGRTRSLVLTCFAAGCVALLAVSGCERPQAAASKGPLGAADIKELVERYQQAHRAKDVEALRAIYQQLRFSNPGPWGNRMIGKAEEYLPALFELELVDVKLIDVPLEGGVANHEYARAREPSPANGFSPVRFGVSVHQKPYKLLPLVRRVGDPAGQVMEIDIGLGADEFDGRLFLTAEDENLRSVSEWLRTGRLPAVHRPPDHTLAGVGLRNLPKQVPADWVCIVRPRP